MKYSHRYRMITGAFTIGMIALAQVSQPLLAARVYWDADGNSAGNSLDGTGLGGGGNWDSSQAKWWDLASDVAWPNTDVDEAVFTAGYVAGIPTLSSVILDSGLVANKLSFLRSGYTLSGGDLTLSGSAPTLHADLGVDATIESQIQGTAGLTKTGGGTVRLTDDTNTYTGTTSISNGILAVNSTGALGRDTSSIVVTGSATRGVVGGALMLMGGYTSGVTLSRNVSLQGLGPVAATGAALYSVGNNTITGTLTNGAGTVNTGIHSAGGRLTLTDVTLGGTTGTVFMTVGAGSGLANVPGIGSYEITGILSGTGSIQKSGGGTLVMSAASAGGYTGTLRVYSGSIRFESVASFGSNSGTGNMSTLDLAGDNGMIEVRMDDGSGIAKNVYMRGGGSPIIAVDHAIGSSAINGTMNFGVLTYDDGETLIFNGRNGYNVSFGTTPVLVGDGNTAFTNNLNGLLTFTGDFWNNPNNTGSRLMTIGGNGNTLIDGSILAPGGTFGHSISKTGTGNLTITGMASTFTGNATVTGTLTIGHLGAINRDSATGSVILGATTTAGALRYTGAADTLAKPFSLAGTTGGGAILSDGTGPLTLTGNVGAGGAGIKTLFLGGTNTGENTFRGLLIDNTSTNTTGVMKIGSGTWVMEEPTYSPSSLGVAANVTIAAPGTTATNTLTLTTGGSTADLRVGQTITIGSTIAQITGILDNLRFTVSSTFTTTTAPAGSYAVSAIPTVSTATAGGTWSGPLTIANGTLKLKATNAASNIVQDTNAIVFNVDTYTANQAAGGTLEFVGMSGLATTETLGALTPTVGSNTVRLTSGGAGGAASLIFSSLGAVGRGSGVNFITSGGGGGTVTINGLATSTATTLAGNGHFYINGSDFARSNGGILVAPVYGVDPGFVTSDSGLTANNHNEITGTFGTDAMTITSLKIAGSHMLALNGNLTVNTGGAGNDGGILLTGGEGLITSNDSVVRSITSGGAGAIVIRVDGASDVLTLSSAAIIAGTTGGLTKNGQGTLVISGVNTQTGITSINEGTVRLAENGRISAANQQLDLRQGATLDLNGLSTGVAIGAFNGAGTVTNSSTLPATLIVGNATTGAGVFSGIIEDGAGVVNVSVTGTTGAPTWSGMNTYTGVTTIGIGLATTAKLVSVPNLADYGMPSSIGRGIQTTVSEENNAASLVFGGLATAGINYTGLTSVSIDRRFTFNGGFTGAGGQIANGSSNNSALILNNPNPIVFGPNATVAQTLTLGGASTGDNLINLQIIDNGVLATRINKIGAGVWILGNAANSYTGTTTIADGVLMALDGSTLPNDSGLILGGTTTSGVFQTSGTFTRDLEVSASAGPNTVSWNTGLTSGGGGFAASTGKLVVAIGGLASPTPLVWNTNGFLGTTGTTTGPLVLSSSTALAEVEFRNAIDLNGATRTITVNDNTTTFTDYATITGVISGAGGITKNGTGLLQLLGANTYSGVTSVTAGQLMVTSLGHSGTPGASSLGDTTNANLAANALTLGNAGTTAGILHYVGAGEVSDRMIRLNTTTGSTQIVADGTGALILTNVVNDMTAGAKALYLRGGSTQGNMITSVLADNTGNLSVVLDQGAVWILSGNNTYNGNTTVSAGALGIGSNNALGNGTLLPRNGALFAYGGDRTVANAVSVASTSTAGTFAFLGDYNLRMTGLWNYTNTTAGHTITNGMTPGTTLTLDGNMALNALTGSITLTFNGTGNTTINGSISSSTTFNASVSYSGDGVFTLNGVNSTAGNLTLNNVNGTLVLGGNNVVGGTLVLTTGTLRSNGTARVLANNVTHGGTLTIGGDDRFTFNGTWLNNGGSRTLTVNTTGGVELAGQVNLSEHATTARTLTINGTGDVLISGAITNGTGTGASALAYTGSGTLTITNGSNSYTGATTLNNVNGTLRLAGAGTLNGGNLTVNAGSLFIESVDQSVATLTMGNVANTNATIDVAAGLTLSPTAITFAGTTTLPSNITGEGTLALGTAGITVTVADNITQAVDMLWTIDNLTGSGVLTKAGTGTLDITGVANNAFTGTFQINAGAIKGLETLTNNIALNGGVYQASGSFIRGLGTGANQIQWLAGGGGFAAVGGDLTVTLAGAPSPLVWGGTASFVPDAAPLIFGNTVADSVTTFTHDINLNGQVRTISAVDNTTVTTDWAVLSGVLSNGGITKTGNGILRLSGANTFAGGLTVSTGTLQFTTVGNTGGGPNNLGQGAITLNGGILSFVGDGAANSQSTNRTIFGTATNSNLAANGINGATITYAGTIDLTGFPGSASLILSGTGAGFITGGISMSGNSADIQPQSGNWTFSGTPSVLVDDFIVTGASVVVNLNSTGVLTWGSGSSTSPNFYLRGGAVLNLGADNAITFLSAGALLMGDTSGVAAENTLNMNGFNLTVPASLTLGSTANVYSGVINGPGTLTVGTTIAMNRGSISANLAGTGAVQKLGMGTVTLSGDNSGLTSATGVRVDAGELLLDYTTNNATKLREATGLDMRGGTLTLQGSASAATTQTVGGLTLASGGQSEISLVSGAGQSVTLNLGAITRANGAGTVRLRMPVSGAITTTTGNHPVTGMLGTTGTAFATVTDATGTYFAMSDVLGNIVPITYTGASNNVTAWLAGAHITDGSTGFTGTLSSFGINSLRFDAAAGSTLLLAQDATLSIGSGGILLTSNVAGTAGISGGRLTSGTGELVVTVDSATALFEVSSSISTQTILTKAGPGTLLLSGSNPHTGATSLQNGTLQLAGGNAIGDRSLITQADDHTNLLQLLAHETIGGLVGGSATSGLDLLATVDIGTHHLTVNQTVTGTYAGKLVGSGRLIKLGATTLALGGASSGFTGDLIVNQGQVTLATRTIANLSAIGSVTLNSGTLLLDFAGGTETANKINDAAPVTLINTGGIDGLRANNDRNDASKTETIGALTFLGGANTVTLQANAAVGSTARQVTITAASLTRTNRATLLVRGNNLGDLGASGIVNSGRFVVTTAPALTGGAGAAGTPSMSILPWAIADATATSSTVHGTGTSFGTYVATTGFRPLNLSTEYEQLAAAGGITATNNVRYSGPDGLILDGADKTMNALLVDNVSTTSAITLSGEGGALNVVSGAFLFTGAQGITLSGFSEVTTGALNEYIFHVTNSSADGVTLGSPLTTATAFLTKSGPGTLILTSMGNTYRGLTTINQGALQIDALDKLGSAGLGGIAMNGGTLRFGGVFDPTSIPLTFGIAATDYVQTTTGGTFDTNGFDISLAGRLGGGGNGGFTKAGVGTLTLNAPIHYAGTTTVTGGTLAYGVASALPATASIALAGGTLDTGGFSASIGNLFITGTSSIAGSAPLNITGDVEGDGAVATRSLAVNNSALTTFSGSQIVLVGNGTTARTLTLTGTGDILITSEIVNGSAAGTLAYTGSGILTVTGNSLHTLTTLNNAAGTLMYAGGGQLSGTALTVNAGTVWLNPSLDQTVGNLTMGGGAAGSSSSLFIGAGRTLTLGGTVTYSNSNNPLAATLDGGVGAILDFGGAARTFIINDSTNAEPDMIIGANITLVNDGGGGIIKQGTGTLHIAGTNNLTGPIVIQAGAVTGNLGTGNLSLNNGVFEGNGFFDRSLGAGGGQVQWVAGASGGFAASGGALLVTLSGTPDPLVWDGTPFFVSGAGGLIFGSTTADDVVTFTHNLNLNTTNSPVTRTITVNDNTDVTTDKAVLPGVLGSSGTGAVTLNKAGTGILELTGANTFSAVTVTAGTLQFSTVTDNGAGPSNLGQGVDGITLAGGTLSFVGDSNQETNRAINLTAAGGLAANGVNDATITYTGAISSTELTLTLSGTGPGIITGGITVAPPDTGTPAADLVVNGGNWTIKDGNVVISDDLLINGGTLTLQDMLLTINDDVVVTGTSTVLNLNSTGVWTATTVTGTSSGLYARNGAIINLNANDINGTANSGGLDFINIGDATAGAAGVLNTNGYNITTPGLLVGSIVDGLAGSVIGGGTITVTNTATDWSLGIRTYRGEISANLAGVASLLKQGLGDVTLSGNNSGLTGTVAGTRIDSGTLYLDFSTDNNNKISSSAALDMRGGTLVINGSSTAATSQSVASFTMGSGGANTISVNSGGQDVVLNLGAITRANGSQDGTIRFMLPWGVQTATYGVTTSTLNGTHGLLGASGFALVNDGTGFWFAANSTNAVGGNIVPLYSTVQNDVTAWLKGEHVTDDYLGFTGTLGYANINSLRFEGGDGSSVNIGADGMLHIASGGILVTSNVGTGSPGIYGGTLVSGAGEVILFQDSPQVFEISSDIRVHHAVTKTGVGTLLLSGNNVYIDETEIQEGTLQVIGGNAIGDLSLVTLADDRQSAFQLLADETIGRLAGGSATDGLRELATVDIGTHTLTMSQNAASTYSGRFTGTGMIVKNGGSFDMTLNNISSAFTGVLRINAGGVIISGVGQINASSIEINKGAYLRITNSSGTRSGTRIADDTTITLNSADGGIAGNLLPRGLYINTDQDTTLDETVGIVTLGSGASYATLEATTANDDSDIIMANLLRENRATISVRGTNLGTTNAQGNQFRIGNAANQTAFIATLIGGSGAAGSHTISIVPWAIGETLSGALAAGNMGNSLVTYVSGAGFRPLDLTSEYDTFTAAGTTDNVRESLTANLSGLAGKTVNSLVIHNNTTAGNAVINFSGSGAGQTLINTSGAFLFTLNPGSLQSVASGINLGGFDGGILVGAQNEYVFHVVNPLGSAVTPLLNATIISPLTSNADITKSGRGTLILTGANTAGGGTNKTTLNEGTLEIFTLDNIGGGTGGLVFAGGTLRLSNTYTGEDLSSRMISFLLAGGTLDTNGHSLLFANSLGSGVGGFTKVGGGTLTLNAAAAYTGPTSILGGIIALGTDNALGSGDLTVNASTLDVGGNNQTAGLVTMTGAGSSIQGAGVITSTQGYMLQEGTASAVLAGSVGMTKTTAAVVTLTGGNTFSGPVEVQAGTLSFNSISNVGGGASALGAPTTVTAGTINMGLTTAATVLNYTGSGHVSDRLVAMQGTTGGVTLDADGTGPLVLGGVIGTTAGAKTLTLQGSSASSVNNGVGAIDELFGTLTLLKTEANTWEFNGSNTYTGATSVNNGILRLNAVQNMAGALNFGSANNITTAGTVDVREDASFGSMTVQTNTGSNTNNLIVATGKTLTINGNVIIGTGVGALSTTLFDASGGGSWVVVNAAASATFRVGGSASNGNVTLADLSGLDSLSVSLNTTNGVFRVNSTSGTNVNGTYSRLVLADNSNITAATLAVGDGGQYNGNGGVAGQINEMLLGTGTTTINVNTINIGTGTRDLGSVTFLDTTGTLTVRAADGVGAAAFNMGSGSSTTAAVLPVGNRNTFDVSGHTADLLFGAMSIGTQNGRTGPMENLFAFDAGTLTAGNLTMGSKTAAGNSLNVMNLGGGTVTIGSGTGTAATLGSNTSTGAVSSTINITGGTVTIGAGSGAALNLGANNTNATGSSTGVLNISGGNVTLATTGTTAAMLATGSSGTATGTIAITGGTVTVQGNIVRGTGSATRNANVSLGGGSLNMSGRSIGAAGNAVTFSAQAGTLTGLGELNGGGVLNKTTTGTLSLGNGNTYTGGTTVTGGTLLAMNTAGSATGTGSVTVLTTATLGGTGSVAGNVQINAGGILAPGAGDPGQLTLGAGMTIDAGGFLDIDLGGPTTNAANAVAAHMSANGNSLVGLVIDASYENYQNGITLHDHVNVTGASAPVINGTVRVGPLLGTYVPQYGDIFDLMDWTAAGNVSGATNFDFSGIPLSPWLGFNTDLFASTGIIVVVPEPSRTTLGLVGVGVLLLRRRRRRGC